MTPIDPLPHDAAGYFDLSGGPRDRRPQGDDERPRGARDRGRDRPPRGRHRAARDRLQVRRCAPHRRQRGDLQDHPEGRRPAATGCTPPSCPSRSSGSMARGCTPISACGTTARPSERLRRCQGSVRAVHHGAQLHRRDARARARHDRGPRPAGEQLQAARARLRGAGVHRLGADQPLGADPHSADHKRSAEPHPDRAALPRSVVEPVPRLRGHAGRRPGRRRPQASRSPTRSRRTCTTSTRPSWRVARSGSSPGRCARRSTSCRGGRGHRRGARETTSSSGSSRPRREEWDEYRMQVSGWEIARYLEAF